jgi:hypothetical protein
MERQLAAYSPCGHRTLSASAGLNHTLCSCEDPELVAGKAGKFPLRTTSENYQKYQSGIPFHNLPKTLQDTVLFAQGIGI